MKEKTLPDSASSKNKLFSTYRNKSKQRHRDFELSKEKFLKLTSSNCFYCGEKPQWKSKSKINSIPYIYNGIDRMDNSIGYIESNCIPCCKNCNFMKRNLTIQKFMEWIDKIYNNTENINHLVIVKNEDNQKFNTSASASRNKFFGSYKTKSKKRGYSFDLSKELFFELTSSNCLFCGEKPYREYRRRKTNDPYICHGIDRIDNSIGYVKNNCVPCCPHCNYAKGEMSISDFINHVKKIHDYIIQRSMR